MTKKEYAINLHDRGCNCAQSVACAFAAECGIDEKTLMKTTEAFGLGCGGTEGICGALSGALTLIGLKYADGNIEAPKTKKTSYAVAKQVTSEFKERCGSLICREIKGIDSGKVLMSCPDCIKNGIELAEKIIEGSYDND